MIARLLQYLGLESIVDQLLEYVQKREEKANDQSRAEERERDSREDDENSSRK